MYLREPVCPAAHVRSGLDAVQEVENEGSLCHPPAERAQPSIAARGASPKGGPLGHGVCMRGYGNRVSVRLWPKSRRYALLWWVGGGAVRVAGPFEATTHTRHDASS